jgi:sigma-B regulation protein RsbU (phosphoserine phosphatase)
MSELISLLDLATSLNSTLDPDDILSAALLIVMGELQVGRGALLVRGEDGRFVVRASRGLPAGAPSSLDIDPPPADVVAVGPGHAAHDLHGLELLCPVHRRDRPIAVLGLGPRAGTRSYSPEEEGFLRSVAACSATPIENGLIHDELRRVNRKLSVKVFQLRNLFDISRELTGIFEEDAIQKLIATTAMGQFMVSRCALYMMGAEGLVLAHERGPRREAPPAVIPVEGAREALEALRGPVAVAELPEGALRDRLLESRMALVVPLAAGGRVDGILAVGERASGIPFSEEDRDFAQNLARQALAALENARLHRMRVDKQRLDRELQIAREIQQSLFPKAFPSIAGFEVAAESHSCFQVGGDYFDFLPLGSGRLGLVVADVSGKGTPASILMASVHAWLQALAGTLPPEQLIERLNRFLFASTQTNKYVTLFYAELDPEARRLAFVNAGHVPPYRVARDGAVTRLLEGGPALGLLEEASYAVGDLPLERGDVLAMVTDGVTEALSTDDREFGDERVCETLRRLGEESASTVLDGLVSTVNHWVGVAGCNDDLTALVLKAR